MKCRKCGTEIAANALICYRCGTAVEELPSIGANKHDMPGWIGLALAWVLLLGAGLVAMRVLTLDVPPTIVWTVVLVLGLVLTGWWTLTRRWRR